MSTKEQAMVLMNRISPTYIYQRTMKFLTQRHWLPRLTINVVGLLEPGVAPARGGEDAPQRADHHGVWFIVEDHNHRHRRQLGVVDHSLTCRVAVIWKLNKVCFYFIYK